MNGTQSEGEKLLNRIDELERENAKLRRSLANSEAYTRKMDGILEEVGGVAVSCINPYEDLKRSLLSLKAIRDGHSKGSS